MRLVFAWIYFSGCKFDHSLYGFIFADGEISFILRGLIFSVAHYVLISCHTLILEKEKLIAKLS